MNKINHSGFAGKHGSSDNAMILAVIARVRKIPLLYKLQSTVRQYFHAFKFRLLVGRPVVDSATFLERAISERIPLAAGKIGSTEAAALKTRLIRRKEQDKYGEPRTAYSRWITHTLFINSGVFPQSEEVFDRFGDDYLQAVGECDVLAAWHVAGEAEILRAFCPHTIFVRLMSLEPYFCDPPWSRVLKGKRVLIISPFSKSVERQYANHEELWRDPKVLPEFELLTIRAPFSAGLVPPDSQDWFEALARLKEKMDGIDYDVALIGAGAFSLPLAVHARKEGKVGIHLGGALQILFGIAGARWDKLPDFKSFINESWCRPSAEETPENFSRNEEGCYW
jgi:hypothetical protein